MWGKGWSGRGNDLGRMDLRDLTVAFATTATIHVYIAVAVLSGLAALWLTPPGMGLRVALSCLGVVVAYPFIEYALHRFILHNRLLYKHKATAALWKRIHFDHHQDPHRLDVLFGSLGNTLPLLAVIGGAVGGSIAGWAGAAAAFATACLVMTGYEFCHCVQHLNYQPKSRWLQNIKRWHLAHHFHNEQGNFGITSGFIDRWSGTHYDRARERPVSATAFNLGYDEAEAARYPWVADLTGHGPHARPQRGRPAEQPSDEAAAS